MTDSSWATLTPTSLFRWAFRWIPLFAWFIRLRMNIRMMRMGRAMATDGDPLNDQMTTAAVKFMESQISDPELREKVRPYSKCTSCLSF